MITGTTVELIQISKLILCYKGIVDLLPQAGMCAREHSWQSTSRRCVDGAFSPFYLPFDIEILICRWRAALILILDVELESSHGFNKQRITVFNYQIDLIH